MIYCKFRYSYNKIFLGPWNFCEKLWLAAFCLKQIFIMAGKDWSSLELLNSLRWWKHYWSLLTLWFSVSKWILFCFPQYFVLIFSHVESVAQCPEMLRDGRCLLLMLPRLVNSRRNVNTFVISTLTKPLATDSFLLAGKNCFLKLVQMILSSFLKNIIQWVINFSSKMPKHWNNYRLWACNKCNIFKQFETSCSVLYISHMRANIFSRSYCTYTLN